ncbi:hypothetical protein DFJ77DRAFT_505484 [Powellomyces hirtus]|nr:hypothetical protein DFJ77DRAFT_505484 [Powellomyces hirtus]
MHSSSLVKQPAVFVDEENSSAASDEGSSTAPAYQESLPGYEDAVLTDVAKGGAPCDGHDGHDHIVQFWETEEYLFNIVVGFVAPALTARDAVVIIATKEHLAGVEATLAERGFNVAKRQQKGQLTLIDALDALSVLQLKDGTISATKFQELVGTLIRRLDRQYQGRICVFGEIVDILAARGQYDRSVDLEELWNGLQERHSFTLLCGYNLNNFRDQAHKDAFLNVCSTHSKVTPGEGFSDLADNPADQNTMVAILMQKSKALEKEIERRKAAEAALHNSLKVLSNHAQEALCRERDVYRTLLSILPVGVYGIEFGDDDDFFINRRFSEIVGRSQVEIRINGWQDAVHPEDRERLASDWPFSECQHCTLTGKYEYRFVLSDGSLRWVAGETATNMDEDGNVRGYVHTILDITELKHIEKERLEAKEAAEKHQRHRAEEAEKHKEQQDQWIDSLCHELRNPLNGINGNVELLEMGLEVRRAALDKIPMTVVGVHSLREQLTLDQECVHAISKCVAHQKVITDDVLNLSKLELGKITLENIEFDPKSTLADVAKMFEAQATRKGLDLRLNFPISDIRIKGDPHRLSQIVVNLLANALKFTDSGNITLALEIAERKPKHTLLRVSVKDTGIGLTTEEAAMLFQRFAQPSSTTHEYGGSGLGLFLSKGLVELMGGSISVETEKLMGSEFIFTFKGEPVDSAAPTLAWREKSNSSLTSHRSLDVLEKALAAHVIQRKIETILVVEDNELNQRIMLRFLQSKGYTVLIANNGLEALSQYERAHLIFMDIQMPVMDGLTATSEIRRLERLRHPSSRIPIVGLSGNARQDHVATALQRGMDEYITKPVKRARIYEVIEHFEGIRSKGGG